MNPKKLVVLLLVVAAVITFIALDLGRYLSLDYLKQSQATLAGLYQRQPFAVGAIYFAVYVVATALSLPGAVILTLAGGAIFGLGWGLLIVSFASSAGATLAFLAARFVLRDSIEARFGNRLAEVNRGIEKDGAFYLFTMRLIPVVPFFVINLVMGLTQMRALTFYGVSQLGMLAGTAVFVNAGTQLARLDSLQGILSPGLLGSFVLLGVFPLIARRIVEAVQKRKVYAKWQAVRPRRHSRLPLPLASSSDQLFLAGAACAPAGAVASGFTAGTAGVDGAAGGTACASTPPCDCTVAAGVSTCAAAPAATPAPALWAKASGVARHAAMAIDIGRSFFESIMLAPRRFRSAGDQNRVACRAADRAGAARNWHLTDAI